jgi:hypothetical protein
MNIKPIVVLIVIVFVALSTATAQDKSFSIEPPTLLSDTHGYDFGRYIGALMNRVRNNWYMMIPDGTTWREGESIRYFHNHTGREGPGSAFGKFKSTSVRSGR